MGNKSKKLKWKSVNAGNLKQKQAIAAKATESLFSQISSCKKTFQISICLVLGARSLRAILKNRTIFAIDSNLNSAVMQNKNIQ